MKKILFLIVLILIVNVTSFAQSEPKNNLRKSLYELKADFPNLIYWTEYGGVSMYKSDNILFELKNNIVIAEFMSVKDDKNNGFPYYWYQSLLEAFNKTKYIHCIKGKDSNIIYFYSYFTISISYDKIDGSASISYELSDRR